MILAILLLAAVDVDGMEKKVNGGLVALGCFAMLVLIPVSVVLSIIIGGYTIQQLWGWFVVPLGLPAIGYLHAAGLGSLFAFMCPWVDTSDLAKKPTDHPVASLVAKLIVMLLVRPGLALLFGYWIHSYMVH